MDEKVALLVLPQAFDLAQHQTYIRRYARWMGEQGVQRLVLISRRSARSKKAAETLPMSPLAGGSPELVLCGDGAAAISYLASLGGDARAPVLLVTDPYFQVHHADELLVSAGNHDEMACALWLSSSPQPSDWLTELGSRPLRLNRAHLVASHPYLDAYRYAGLIACSRRRLAYLLGLLESQAKGEELDFLELLMQRTLTGVHAVPLAGRPRSLASWEEASFGQELSNWHATVRRPCLFLDRDGVLIEDTGYPYRSEDLRIIPEVIELIDWAKERGFLIIVVSNQAGVAKGRFNEADLRSATHYLTQQLEALGAQPDDWYYCLHHPEAISPQYRGLSLARKPGPGLILTALGQHKVDLERSWMIGDRDSDRIELPYLCSLLVRGRYPLTESRGGVFASHQELLAFLQRKAGSRRQLFTSPGAH